MAMTIIDDEGLKIGQVKSITSDFGRSVDYTELLFSPTTKAQFQPNEEKTGLIFSVSDSNFDLPEMVCELDRGTLRNLIVALKNMYNELSEPVLSAETDGDEENQTEQTISKSCCNKNLV